jgi:soluble lytic murein transglycosylase-like protein
MMFGFAWATPKVSAKVLEIAGPAPAHTAPERTAQDQAVAREFARLQAAPEPVALAIHRAAIRNRVPVELVEAVAWKESRFEQDAVSHKGAIGVMQLTPATADTLGVDAQDMAANVDGGAAYLAKLLRRFGDTRLALAAYNAGPNTVDRYGGVPPYKETQDYVQAIMTRLATGPA